MKLLNKLISTATVAVMAVTMAAVGFVGSASAACIQYDPNGFNTPTTPVFNNICGVPNIGNESDFVRIRQSSNGDVKDNQNNPNFTGTTITSACNAGDKFDLWNYIHNDATPNNNNNGSGTSVAHDVAYKTVAHLNTPGSAFRFEGTVSASNASSVTDQANLDCGNKVVKLSLSPSSVHVYSQQYGWRDLNDNVINTNMPIGSPTPGSGAVWGCWDYRVIVVYQVTVQEIPQQPQQSLSCTLLDLTAIDNKSRKVHAKVTGSAQNTTISSYKIEWGDNSSENVQEKDHTYASNGTYTVRGSVTGTVNGQSTTVSDANCVKQITFGEAPPQTPPQTPQTPPAKLVDTGAGDVVGIFAATTIVGTVLHKMRSLHKFGR